MLFIYGLISGSGVGVELRSYGLVRVVLFQPPVFRREAPATLLAEALGAAQISFGDLMRAHLSQGTELGSQVAGFLNSGRLVPDEICTAVVGDRLRQATDAGFLLVGHPSSVPQAFALDQLLEELDEPLDGVVHLHVPQVEVERQVLLQAARRVCREDSNHRFEPEVDQLLVDGVCNVCGGELVQHQDDNVLRTRFGSLKAMLEPITQHYARQDLLVTIDAVGTPEAITRRALTALRGLCS
jgi:adenylate kinase